VRTLAVSWKRFSISIPVHLYAVRRTEFDHWLLARSGAQVDTHRVEHVRIENGSFILDQRYRCRYLVGAGGTNCPVARTFFKAINPRPTSSLIVAIAQEVPVEYATSLEKPSPLLRSPKEPCRVWFFYEGIPGYAWYLPKAGGTVNVGIGGKALAIRRPGRTLLSYWRQFLHYLLQEGLLDTAFVSEPTIQNRPPTHGYYLWEGPRILKEGNAFVLGDAAGLATADMGEGIANAVCSGILVAQAIGDMSKGKGTVSLHQTPGKLRSGIGVHRELIGISSLRSPSGLCNLRRWSEPWPFSRILQFFYR
jgi:flavin-dependent dehydrogenase